VLVSSRPAPTTDPPAKHVGGISRSGLFYAIGAYGLWGILPIYFIALEPTGPFEIVAWRVLFSLVFCALLIAVTRAWRAFAVLVRDRRVVLTMGLAGLLIFVNWQTYVYATLNGQVVEAALGYFINPIVTVLLGVIVLRERLNATQWVAVGISIVAVVVLAFGYGQLPWIALVLAFSFGIYGLIKKRVGPKVDAVSGLTLETAWLAPLAVVQLVFVGMTTGLTIGTAGAWHTVLLVSAGAAPRCRCCSSPPRLAGSRSSTWGSSSTSLRSSSSSWACSSCRSRCRRSGGSDSVSSGLRSSC